ncbi:MAG: UDP-N-acetylmuramoyl-tripeptide--D-alanyl-D-alanine ligase [bacterium]|nr:UDP-N-acetylmuramoyl-tripeptide--D-alanyl-D-alanine ligase [bacterium]
MKDFFKNIAKKLVVAILTLEARIALARHKPQIIAVTGSVGKTATKDAIYAVVSGSFETRKSQKSMNSEIGLPLTILGLENAWSSLSGWWRNIWRGAMVAFVASGNQFPKWLVLEVGADHPRDIEKISHWLHPNIVVLTRMADVPVHIEYFKNTEEVLREKMFLARALKPKGTLIVNADDSYFMKTVRDLDAKKVFYGTSSLAEIKIIETGILYDNDFPTRPRGQYGILNVKNRTERIELNGVIGKHLMYSIATACAVASVLNVTNNLSDIFEQFDMPRGRMRLLKGKSGSIIIDDTYNSSPIACTEALKTLANLSVSGKKIAVLGDMKELGIHAEKAHRDIGKLAGEIVHTLITVGKLAKHIASGAREAGMSPDHILSFETSEQTIKAIADILHTGDVILVKGSQSMRMEKIVEVLLKDQNEAKNLLVRQEEEWQKR